MAGHASAFPYEEDFGPMDRVHWLIHMSSADVYYAFMDLDAHTDENAPGASYLQDQIFMDRDGGSWDRMLGQGNLRNVALTPRR